MKLFLLGVAFLFTPLVSVAQVEICDNGIDDDNDSFIDCYDPDCSSNSICDGIFLGNDGCTNPPPTFPAFSMSLDFASPDETTNSLSRMTIGDLDRDGLPEIVTMNRYTDKIFILNGNDGTVKYSATVPFEPYWEVAMGNINDDNCAELFFHGYYDDPVDNTKDGIYFYSYDCQLNFLWRSDKKLLDDPINYGLADFDQDGLIELYAKNEIFDAHTGIRIIKSSATTRTNYNRINGGPVAVNITGDTKLELVVGLNVYNVTLGARTSDIGTLTLAQKGTKNMTRSEYFIRDVYNATSVADFNQDGFLDVIASGSTIGHDNNTTVFFWDINAPDESGTKVGVLKTYKDNTSSYGANGWSNGTGRLNIADLDGDGQLNVSFVSGKYLYALDQTWGNTPVTKYFWRIVINEETSGYTGCTLFDFNGDYKSEIVYRDEQFLYILDGTNGSILGNALKCKSRTNREYPIVADVDADGSTELCVTCISDDNEPGTGTGIDITAESQVRVYKSGDTNSPWVPARRVWNQHGYFVVNVNDDLSIPRVIQAHHNSFSTTPCPPPAPQNPPRPLNKFLNQAPFLNTDGCPTYSSPDIAFQVTPTVTPPTCPDLNFKVSFKVTNLGDVAVTGDIPVSFYTTNPFKAGATRLGTILVSVANLQKGDIISVDNASVTGVGADSLYVVLNDAGAPNPIPVVLPNTTFYECDYDNVFGVRVNPLPVSMTALHVSDNEQCLAAGTGVARAFVPNGAAENTADYFFYWSVGAVAKPPATADYQGAVYSGLTANTYTVYARHKTANCNSDTAQVVINDIPGTMPAVSVNVLQNQTSCAPANGKLEAVIAGGGAGYTVEWFDLALNPLGITGMTANNLTAGSYVAVVSRGTCSEQAQAVVEPPSVADASATATPIIDCTNPNSGSLSATAIISGVPQDPASYTFTWYKYNVATSTQGHVIDPIHGTGPSRTGLPVGGYQVEVKDNASQCVSTVKPVVQVTSQTVIPDPPQIVILASQTSCDPAQPNGVLTANVFIAGVAQNPADFSFQWFKGQNTLPVNQVPAADVSDVNGKTVSKVAGGGIPYTVKVTTSNNCSAIADLPVTENIQNPVITLAQLSPNSICDPANATLQYNGSLQATVTFGGNPVTLPDNNYVFTWRNPANAIIAVADNKNPVLAGLADGNSYSVTVTRSDLFCPSNVDTEPVTRATVLPALSATSTGSNNCNAALTPDGTVTVSITNTAVAPGPFTYQWYDGNAVGINPLGAANNGTTATTINVGGPAGAPRPYTVEVLNTSTGCRNNTTQFVADNSIVPVLSTSTQPNSICAPANNFNGSMTVSVTNIPALYTIADYTFVWYDGNTTATPHAPQPAPATSTTLSQLDVGTYSVIGTNTKTGCVSALASNQVANTKIFPTLVPGSTGSNNCDVSLTPDGSATVTISGTVGPYTFQWHTGSGNPAALTPIAGATSQTLNNVGGPNIPVGAAPHFYTVTVTATTTGCSNYTTASVSDNSVVPVLSTSTLPNSICAPAANYNGRMTVSVTNIPALYTIADYRFTWQNATPSVIQGPSASTVLDKVDAGTYTVTGVNIQTGCTSTVATNTVANSKLLPSLTPSSTGSNNCIVDIANGINNDGTASVAVTVTAGPYSYAWYNGSGDPATLGAPIAGATAATITNVGGPNVPVGSAPRFYTVLVTDTGTGCSSYTSTSVADVSAIPVLSTSTNPNSICSPSTGYSGSMTVSLSNAQAVGVFPNDYTFTWYDGTTTATPHVPQPGLTVVTLPSLDAGQYAVTGRNNKTGCLSALATNTVANTKLIPSLATSSTGSNNCINAAGINPDGTASVTVTVAAGPFNFQWYVGSGDPIAGSLTQVPGAQGGTSSTATGLGGPVAAPNAYTVLVTDQNTGCSSFAGAMVADVSQKPTFTLTPTPNSVCDIGLTDGPTQYNGFVTISAVTHPQMGASTVTNAWFNAPGGVVGALIPGQTGTVLNNLDDNFYAATVTIDDLGCTSDPLVREVLDDLDLPVVTTNMDPNTHCVPAAAANGVAEVTDVDGLGATAAYTYNWYDGLVVAGPPTGTTAVRGTSLQGPNASYTVEVMTKATGCRATRSVTVVDVILTPTVSAVHVSNNTICDTGTIDANGSLTATSANVGANITYNWTAAPAPATATGADNVNFTKLAAGSYTVTVTDDDTGCVSVADSETIVDNLTYPTINVAVQDQTTCAGPKNGRLTATSPTVGTKIFSWFDEPAMTTPHAQTAINSGIINQLAAGDYTVHVRIQETGCEGVETRIVANNITNPSVTLSNTQLVTTCGATPNGQATATITGLSGAPVFASTLYDIYYAFTKAGGTPPMTSVAVIAAANANNRINETVNPPPVYTGLAPGYLTAYVLDKNTQCSAIVNTEPILDNLESYDINIDALQQAAACGGAGGGIAVTVERSDNPGVNCATCSFSWYQGTPNNTNINFFDNPPNMSSAVLLGAPVVVAEDLGAPAFAAGVGTATYTLVVVDTDPTHLNCGNYKTEFIPPTSIPTLTEILTPVTDCVTPNGQISITVNGASPVGYTLRIFAGTQPLGLPIATLAAPANPAVLTTTATLSKGEYYVEILDNDPVNLTCPFGEVFEVDQIVAPPILTPTATTANTSCNPLVVADGSVTIRVDNDPGDTQAKIYRVTSVAPVVGGYATPNLVGAAGASGQSETIPGLRPIAYSFTITDQNSNCATTLSTTVPDAQGVPGALSVVSTPETFCSDAALTLSNGSALASIGGVALADHDFFDFTWAQNNDLSASVYAATGANGANNLGELLNRAHATANTPGNFWPMGTVGNGSGDRIFYVQATKNASAPTGVGCKTGIIQVVIPDQHLTPNMTLTPTFDSFCQPDAGNTGDGMIVIAADADPATAGQQGTFNYAWTNANAFLASPQLAQANNFTIPRVLNNSYQVTATNSTTGCAVQNTVVVPAAPYVIAINSTDPVIHQRICTPDGLIRVNSITLTDNSAGSPNTQTTANASIDPLYNFEWWFNNPSRTVGSELRDGGGAGALISERTLSNDVDQNQVVNQPGDYHAMSAGTFYAVATRTDPAQIGFGCKSLPFQVNVNDVHINPIPALAPFSNTSCIPAGPGEGEIRVNVADATAAPFNAGTFSYTWNVANPTPIGNSAGNNGNGSGLDADNDHPTILLDGTYSVTIQNSRTGCSVIGTTTIIKNATPVFVQTATVVDEVNCFVGGDGSITVSKVTLNDRTGATVDFLPAPPPPGAGDIANFNFEWRRAGVGPQTTASRVLNSGNYNAGTLGGTAIGAGIYTVVAVRNVGVPGAGCRSAPFQVEILDKKVDPVVTLTTFSNTACDNNHEGEIKVRVTDGTTATPPVGGFRYTYTWTTAPNAMGPFANNNGNEVNDGDNDYPTALEDGAYSLNVMNQTTQCVTAQSTTIVPGPAVISLDAVTVLDQEICSPDGAITVDRVTVNNRNNVGTAFTTVLPGAGTTMLTDFQFEWRRNGDANNALLITNGAAAPAGATLNAATYAMGGFAPTFGFGTYTVVARRKLGNVGSNCTSAPFTVQISDKRIFPVVTLTPFANTSCSPVPANFEGEIEVEVTDANPRSVNPDLFTYNWTASATPGVITGLQPGLHNGNKSGSDGDGDNPGALMEGNYTITVTNNQTTCASSAGITIFKNATPVITQLVTPTDQVLCTADGRLVVNEVRVIDRDGVVRSSLSDFPIANFDFTYARTTVGNVLPGVTTSQLNNVNYPAIGADTYFVSAARVAGGPGFNCTSPPFQVTIQNKQILPIVSLTPFANTSCDPVAFEGEIEVRVTDNSVNLPAPFVAPYNFNYSHNWTTSSTTGVINGPVAGSHDGDGLGGGDADGAGFDNDGDHPRLLREGAYVLSVTNNQTGCVSTGSTTIFKNSTPVFTQLVLSTPQVLCNPDGTLTVQEVKVIDRNGNIQSNINGDFPLSDFAFSYDRGAVGNTVVNNAHPSQPVIQLNTTTYPAIGLDAYYVVATRIAGGPGVNCASAPFKVDIQDRRVFPKVDFASLVNSSCTNALPNGTVMASASEPNGSNTGPYTFVWTLNGQPLAVASPPSVVVNTSPTSTVNNALHGSYTIVATNNVTGCPVTVSTSLSQDQTLSTPNIIDVATTDPVDCNPSGTATVTKITLGSTSRSILFPPNAPPNNEVTGAALNGFNYEWYRANVAAGNQLPAGGPPFTTTPNIGSLLPDTYFVIVHDPTTDCRSGGKQFEIVDDNIVYPVLGISQSAKQVSCIGVGSAVLNATGDGQDDTNPNYTFSWFSNSNTTPPSFATTSTVSGLVAGTYSVRVVDLTTACAASDSYVVTDDTQEFMPVVSTGSQPRTLCVGTDGSISARALLYPAGYPYPYNVATFTADIYFGLTPDLTAPPDIPSIPLMSGFVANFEQGALNEGAYTVRITDNNTGCVGTAAEIILDSRAYPQLAIHQIAPVTNCDPAKPNGVARATASGTFVGYQFDWYEGATVTGLPIYTGPEYNLLKVAPQQYAVRATNLITGCTSDLPTSVTDGTVPIPAPTIEILSSVTSCVVSNGKLTAYVGSERDQVNYTFHWYDGNVENPPADKVDPVYGDLAEGEYSVTATSIATGCKSPLVTKEILIKRRYPEFGFLVKNSSCEQSDGYASLVILSDVPVGSIEWAVPGQLPFLSGPNYPDAAAGTYDVTVTSDLGCEATKTVTIENDIRPFNGISRNNDTQNSFFQIDCIQYFENNIVKIFNRAGTLVYEGRGYNNETVLFDGKSNKGVSLMGTDLPDGTYYFIIDKRNGSKPVAGYLEIVK